MRDWHLTPFERWYNRRFETKRAPAKPVQLPLPADCPAGFIDFTLDAGKGTGLPPTESPASVTDYSSYELGSHYRAGAMRQNCGAVDSIRFDKTDREIHCNGY